MRSFSFSSFSSCPSLLSSPEFARSLRTTFGRRRVHRRLLRFLNHSRPAAFSVTLMRISWPCLHPGRLSQLKLCRLRCPGASESTAARPEVWRWVSSWCRWRRRCGRTALRRVAVEGAWIATRHLSSIFAPRRCLSCAAAGAVRYGLRAFHLRWF